MTVYEFEGRVPEIAATAYVAPSAQVIGRVVIGEECWIGHGAILRGDYGTILVGDQTAVEDGVIVHARPDDTTRLGRRQAAKHVDDHPTGGYQPAGPRRGMPGGKAALTR